MKAALTARNCERVRAQVSLLLDGESSQLERRMVAAHLTRCADCRAFEQSVAEFTAELRAAPLEPISRPVVIPRSRRISIRSAQVGVAAVVAIALLGVANRAGVEQLQREKAARPVPSETLFLTSWQPERELANIDNAHATTDLGADGPQTAI